MGNYVRQSYHTQMQPWRRPNNKPVGRLVGIELEIEHRDGYQRILDALPNTKLKLRPQTEQDASISTRDGVEIIFPPYKYSTIKNGSSFITKATAALRDANCHAAPTCGLHVNVNTRGWNNTVKLLFMAIVHALPANVLKKIGGRDTTRHCRQLKVDWYGVDCTPAYIGARCKNNHYTATSLRANRIELRFPKATTDINRIRLVVDFAFYAEKFAKRLAKDNVSINKDLGRQIGEVHIGFRQFLEQQKQTKAVKQLIQCLRG